MEKKAAVVAVLDGDIIATQGAARFVSGGGTDPEELFFTIDNMISEWTQAAKADKHIVCLSEGRCFRYQIYPDYKGNRRGKEKPRGTEEAKQHIRDNYSPVSREGLEADDVMGILATEPQTDEFRVIVSRDKDMKTVPAWQMDPEKDRFPWLQSEDGAWKCLCEQWMTGDSADGYKGIPGFGPKAFEKWWYEKHRSFTEDGECIDAWDVEQVFIKENLTAGYAKQMYRCAQIHNWETVDPNSWIPRGLPEGVSFDASLDVTDSPAATPPPVQI